MFSDERILGRNTLVIRLNNIRFLFTKYKINMEIYDTNDSFDFEKVILTKPTLISGGNYFIRCLVNNSPLYIQPPKSKTKQGFTKIGKRFSCDLMFTNENENFIRWMENLENYCQQFIYRNREKWFDNNMEFHDIENYFTSPLKLYKSGKFYIVRVNSNISSITNKPALKIYDENENEVDIESIVENTNVLTIFEIQGIKCSTRSFQIEIDLKQMMVLQQNNIFERCIIKPKTIDPSIKKSKEEEVVVSDLVDSIEEPIKDIIADSNLENIENANVVMEPIEEDIEFSVENSVPETKEQPLEETEDNILHGYLPEVIDVDIIQNTVDGMEEIDFNLEELTDNEPIQIKKRNDVYYEMYREARRKAKVARDLALSSYLEAKRIKNTYMLDDIEDSDSSDLEMEEDSEEENSLDE